MHYDKANIEWYTQNSQIKQIYVILFFFREAHYRTNQ